MDSSSLECHCAVNGANKSLPLLFKLNWSKGKMLGDLEHILPVCNSRLLLVCSYTASVCFICCVLCGFCVSYSALCTLFLRSRPPGGNVQPVRLLFTPAAWSN